MNNKRRNWFRSGQAAGYEPEYQAVLDRAALLGYTTPDSTTNTRNNDRVKNLKAAGIWVKLDLLYMFDMPSGLADFSKINYIDPDNYELFNSNPSLEPAFVAGSGFESDGTLWFSTGFNCSTNATHFVPGSILGRTCVFWRGFNFAADSTNETICGALTGGNNSQINIIKASNNTQAILRIGNNTTAYTFGATKNNNHILQSSSGTSSGLGSNIYEDGASLGITSPVIGASFSNLVLYLFASNLSGAASNIGRSGMKYFGLGGFLGSSNPNTEADDLYNIMNDTY